MRLTIKTKLAGAFGVVIALSMAAGGLAYFKLSEMTETQTAIIAQAKRIDAAGNLINYVNGIVRSEKNAILASDDKDIERYVAEAVRLRSEIDKVHTELHQAASEQGKKQLDEAAVKRRQLVDLQDKVLANAKLNSNFRAAALWNSETQPLIQGVTAASAGVVSEVTKPSASPELLRAGIELFSARLEWLRLTRSVALVLGASSPAEAEKMRQDVERQSQAVRGALAKSGATLSEFGIVPTAMMSAFDKGIDSVLRVATIAGAASNLKASEQSSTEGRVAAQATIEA